MRELFTFDDVIIVPKFSLVPGRSEEFVSLKSNIRGLTLPQLPVISANMDTVTGARMAQVMVQNGAQACLHRFGTIDDTREDFLATKGFENRDPAMVSVGLGSHELERAEVLFQAGAHTFVVDVAHGAQISVANQVKLLRELLGSSVNIIVGNFATGDSVRIFLEHTGNIVDGIKVGIGPGSACTTRIKTGVGIPQLSAILDVAQTLRNTEIVVIADGGMKKEGDIAKALGAGAHMVMLGGMLSGTYETPGEAYFKDKSRYLLASDHPSLEDPGNWFTGKVVKVKKYRGSASQESYEAQGKVAKYRAAEGESFYVPYKGSVVDVLQGIEGGLRSSLTYVGASNLKEYRSRVEFVRVTPSTVRENEAHGKND